MGEINKYMISVQCDGCMGETTIEHTKEGGVEHPQIGEVYDKCEHCDGVLWVVGVRWMV
jgi:hypothetical protein